MRTSPYCQKNLYLRLLKSSLWLSSVMSAFLITLSFISRFETRKHQTFGIPWNQFALCINLASNDSQLPTDLPGPKNFKESVVSVLTEYDLSKLQYPLRFPNDDHHHEKIPSFAHGQFTKHIARPHLAPDLLTPSLSMATYNMHLCFFHWIISANLSITMQDIPEDATKYHNLTNTSKK